MVKMAVVQAAGKQYLVKENEELVVDKIHAEVNNAVELDVLALLDDEGKIVELGKPTLKSKIKAQIVEQGKGEKIRVARFKAKVRYRKVKGFRPQLTKIKILSV